MIILRELLTKITGYEATEGTQAKTKIIIINVQLFFSLSLAVSSDSILCFVILFGDE